MESKYNLTKFAYEDLLKPYSQKHNIPMSVLSQMYQIMKEWDTEQEDFYIDCIDGKRTWEEWYAKYGKVEFKEDAEEVSNP